MYKCCMELGNNAINKFIAKNLLSCFKCRINNLFQEHTCYSSRFSPETIFPLSTVPTLLKNSRNWNLKKKSHIIIFWNCSWEFVTLAKVSHLQPFFSPGHRTNKSVLHVAFLFSKAYGATTTVCIYVTPHRT